MNLILEVILDCFKRRNLVIDTLKTIQWLFIIKCDTKYIRKGKLIVNY